MVLSANGNAAATVYNGEPLLVVMTVSGSDVATPVPLDLAIATESGEPVSLPVALRSQTETTRLGSLQMYSVTWTVSPEEISKLAPGNYTLRLAGARPATFRIRPDRREGGPETHLLLSAWAEAEGEQELAVEHAEALLAEQPLSIAGRVRKADLLAAQGKTTQAIELLAEAAELEHSNHGGKAPRNSLIQRKLTRLLE
jgi:hypothetical protein